MGKRFEYIKGQKIHPESMLTYIRDAKTKGRNRAALFRCDCGVNKVINITNVKSLNTKSCGCFCIQQRVQNATKHKLCDSPEYKSWSGMLQRCKNSNNPSYLNYGGKGISVCDQWCEFENFYIDMGRKPNKNYQLDRIDNQGNYEPNNCRWICKTGNLRNQSSSKWWFIDGVRYESATDAASQVGVALSTIRAWCGLSPRHNKKHNCWSELKYK